MSAERIWPGARWWKFDFHTHTPASDDYGKGSKQENLKAIDPREWLLNYMRAGIDCVAITDHNTGAWIDLLKSALQELKAEKPEGYQSIYLFPGVEISVNGGVHLLAILDGDKSTSDIDSLLGAVRYPSDRKGGSDAVTEASFTEVVAAISKAGGIAIPAHVDCNNGLFGLHGPTLEQAIGCSDLFAMEILDASANKPQSYMNKTHRWTEVLGSDAHHAAGQPGQSYPGSHFTWVKMGTPSLDGLRLALLDGPLSVRRSDQVTKDPNNRPALAIETIEVSQARYMGRSKTFVIELNPWLNAIIGGRGTGKSTLVEFLRLALRRENEIPEALARDFEKYWRVYRNRDDDGLLTEDSAFSIIYRKDRTRFRVQWSQRDNVESIEVQDENGEWKSDEGDVSQRFPVRIYSQKQIFELAKTPLALLRIVDDAPEVNRHSWDDQWREEEARFLSLRARAREIEAGLADEPRLRGELEDVKRRLSIFEEARHADVLKDYQKRLRQQRAMEAWEETWSATSNRLRELAAEIVPNPLDDSLFDAERAEDQDILQKSTTPVSRLNAVQDRLNDLAEETEKALDEWAQIRDSSDWKLAVDNAVEEYERLRQRLDSEEVGDPSAYGELVERRQALEQRLAELQSRRKELEGVRLDAENSLTRLRELRRNLTQRRIDFLDKILAENPYVRIQVMPYGAHETVETEFRRLLQREGGGFEKDIGSPGGQGLLGNLYCGDNDMEGFEQRLMHMKEKIRNIASQRSSPGDLADKRFARHIQKLPPEALDRIDTWFPEDSLKVSYSTKSDGTGFRPIQEGSPGQKTAALLAFLFSYGEEPIILDQPEDDLDNHLIYDLIVGQLRRIKRRRQVIVVTHNANIVVNGDAEQVVALVSRGGETHQECAGSLQEGKVRDTICAVMEGGREAFEQRYRRIALHGRRS